MAVHTRCVVLQSTYRDSVALMQVSRNLERMPGVQRAAVMMGTQQNRTLLREAGLLTSEGEQAGANDLLICVLADAPEFAERAVQEAKQLLSRRWAAVRDAAEMPPRTLETAIRRLPEANLACISVPGRYASHEARKALERGLHVFLFSDHVALEAEEELKRLAAQKGLLLMGPECGTAIISGAPLGFANQVVPGPVGLISASGTGLQQVACLLARGGIGVSQAIGVGGRDLHRRLGGHGMRAALHALAADRDTRVVVLISKPPDEAVAARLAQEAAQIDKPCVLTFVGGAPWSGDAPALYFANTLEDAALVAGALARGEAIPTSRQDVLPELALPAKAARAIMQPGQQTIWGLYCGGTLAHEALWLLRRYLGEVNSNLDGTLASSVEACHVVLDLGAEEFTSARPHPMIDPTVRNQRILDIARRPEVAVVLCDVMLGWGAHPDPATELAEAWREAQEIAHAKGRNLIGIATVCGTPDDPQGYEGQCRVLEENGIILAESNAQAVRLAAAAVGGHAEGWIVGQPREDRLLKLPASGHPMPVPGVPSHLPALFAAGPRVVNLGLEWFVTQLEACGVPVVHVDWHPPAGGDARLASLLERLG